MRFSFSINSKSKSNRLKKPSAFFSAAFGNRAVTFAGDDSSTRNYVREFKPHEAPPVNKSKIKPIAPIPNEWPPHIKKLKNLPNLPSLTQTNGSDSSLQFELDPESNLGAALLSAYGEKEGQGIGRNPKEDIKVYEVATKKTGRVRLGFTEEFSDNRAKSNGKAAENLGNANVEKNEGKARKKRKNF